METIARADVKIQEAQQHSTGPYQLDHSWSDKPHIGGHRKSVGPSRLMHGCEDQLEGDNSLAPSVVP